MTKTILFVSHHKKQCGVYEFGKDIYTAIASSLNYTVIKAECDSLIELRSAIATHHPEAIIYNYHPSVMPWLCTKVSKGVYKNNIASLKVVQIGIVHEITQQVADTATAYRNKYIIGEPDLRLNSLFDFYIAPDPTLLLKNRLVFKTGRLIPSYTNNQAAPSIPTIGSFGFATPKKGFSRIVQLVQQEFDEAVINLNIPSADYGDKDGSAAHKIMEECRSFVKKPGIQLNVSYDFLNKQQLLDFLAKNSMNVFLYEDTEGRGISSAIDNALAVRRPIAVSNCPMFRHILTATPSVCVDDLSLKQILNNGFAGLEQVSKDWHKDTIVWEYERILNAVLTYKSEAPSMGIINTLKSKYRRVFSLPDKTFTWLRNSEKANDDDMSVTGSVTYQAIAIPDGIGFNRILDNSARALYKPAIDQLIALVPKTMAKKIPAANVQQAFVFDTVYRNLANYSNPKLLCVGSYEDTASMGLIKMGYKIEEIDPMINYFLQEYYTKPSTQKNSYDIIFSTSVIEHDPDDQSFLECIHGLLAPNGIAVITCDYKDGWKPGDPKPAVDARFYTKQDLEQRMLSYLPGCELIDTPQWDCPNPDFDYYEEYQYTFATFVFRKKA
jgi:SAM-dependent methyltransferase